MLTEILLMPRHALTVNFLQLIPQLASTKSAFVICY
jgi:hypothetical protein